MAGTGATARFGLAGFTSTFFVSPPCFTATLDDLAAALSVTALACDTGDADLAAGAVFAVTDFAVTVFLTGALTTTLAAFFTSCFGVAFGTALATTLPLATTFAVPLAAIFGAGLAVAFTAALATVLGKGLPALFATGFAAGFATGFLALLATVLLRDLDGLLVVVIFGADPNFRLAAFFSVAGEFGKILFALADRAGFAGFFMLSPLNQNQGLIERAICSLNCTTVFFALYFYVSGFCLTSVP